MSYIKEEFEFPCGLKIKSEAKGWDVVGNWDIKDIICPIHDKKCKRRV